MELIHTTRLQDRLCWRAEPCAHADGVGQPREASQAIPEGCAEDVSVEGLFIVYPVSHITGNT
jgi:hypothetical protein